MPFKDPEKRKQYNKEYNAINSKTPYGKFMAQKKSAVYIRHIKWKLTFDDWWQIWQDSGHWEERGQVGYFMCRKGDVGPYSVDNVYIATTQINGRDAWINGKTRHLPEFKLSEEQRNTIRNHEFKREDTRKFAELYDVSIWAIYYLRKNKPISLIE